MPTNEEVMGALFRNEAQALAFRMLRTEVSEMNKRKKISRMDLTDMLDKLEGEARNRLAPIRDFLISPTK